MVSNAELDGGRRNMLEGSVLPFARRTDDDYKGLSQDTWRPAQDLYQLPPWICYHTSTMNVEI